MFKRMTVKKQVENPCETPPMEGFSWGVLIGAFIGNSMVQICGAVVSMGRIFMTTTICFNFDRFGFR